MNHLKVLQEAADAVPESPIGSTQKYFKKAGFRLMFIFFRHDGEGAAKSLNHSLTHYYPTSRHCEICQRANVTSRYHRRRGDPGEDYTPPLHFGHQKRLVNFSLEVTCQEFPKASRLAWFVSMGIAVGIKLFHSRPAAPQTT